MRFGLTLFALISIPAAVAAAPADDPHGGWLRGDGAARVEVATCGPSLCMTNVWIRSDVTEEKVGEFIRFDLKPAGPGRWKGTGYDPQRQIQFTTEMVVSGETMTTSGCIMAGLMCRSTQWSRLP
jgi:uncharacterized protein (DUF2147 family)